MKNPRGLRLRVKVCGITNVEDARRSVELGAALLGLNFYAGSPRCVTLERAREIAAAVEDGVTLVGVFVNEPALRMEEIAAAVGLDLLQLHGDESVETVNRLGARALKAMRWEGRPAQQEFDSYPGAWGFLLDRKLPGIFGGTGQPWNYADAAALPTAKPVLIAGGVGADNVRGVIEQARPWGVDVCSRVERVAGVKDPSLLERLFQEIADAEASLPAGS
jgi:phosphoribosylanthranilate isomerase